MNKFKYLIGSGGRDRTYDQLINSFAKLKCKINLTI
jgi:hypothetical protein